MGVVANTIVMIVSALKFLFMQQSPAPRDFKIEAGFLLINIKRAVAQQNDTLE